MFVSILFAELICQLFVIRMFCEWDVFIARDEDKNKLQVDNK